MTAFLRSSTSFLTLIEQMCCWFEVINVSRNEPLRPSVGRLCSEVGAAWRTTIAMMSVIRNTATEQEMNLWLTKLHHESKKSQAAEIQPDEDENVEQEEDEDVKHKKREDFEAAAAAYAIQDRDDSCSDSD